MDDLTFCLNGVGKSRLSLTTLVVKGAGITARPPQDVWKTWTDLATWPQWSPLHKSTAWVEGDEFVAGNRFDQVLDLGFPVGTTTGRVSLDLVEPAGRVSWSSADGGIRTCHLWHFEELPDGGTRVSNTEVFDGVAVALIRPLVARRWRNRFQTAVDHLLASVG